jgi:hypothetical protein
MTCITRISVATAIQPKIVCLPHSWGCFKLFLEFVAWILF